MKKRFSSQELFEIRNAIPVDMLIKDRLQIPSNISQGVFRFCCPICKEFNTSVNPATNLGRCFSCRKNFNTIDIVMDVRKLSFKESVLFLKTVLAQIHAQRKTGVTQGVTTAYHQTVQPASKTHKKPLCNRRRDPVTIRQIFQQMFLDGETRS